MSPVLGCQGSISLAVTLLATMKDKGRDLSSAGLVGPARAQGMGCFLASVGICSSTAYGCRIRCWDHSCGSIADQH